MSAYAVRLGVRLFTPDGEKCFGPGIAELLERIGRDGSLRKAAGEMGMAYSRAWHVVNDCEKALGFELIARSVGGREGGGSRLTEKGAAMLRDFRKMEASLKERAGSAAEELFP
jgi:molybdate transport system regulatory protein/xanthine dehydrogenase accessory factor